jgi:hypothetical protein
MNLNKLLIKDSSGKPSVTMTAFVTGFMVVNAKLLISGLKIAGYTMAAFTGGEYAAAVGALGAVYVMRRSSGKEDGSGEGK